MVVYAIRHAESLANAGLEDCLNSALSERGRAQANALGRRFTGCPARAIYSSPFMRALETVEPIARSVGLSIRIRPELCEFQGLPPGAHAALELGDIESIVARFPSAERCPDHVGPAAWPPPDEPLSAMISRMRSFAAHLKSRWSGCDDIVILVGHGSPTARLIEAWLTDQPGPAFRFTIDNAAVAGLRFVDGVSSLICLNEASHLRPQRGSDGWRRDHDEGNVW